MSLSKFRHYWKVAQSLLQQKAAVQWGTRTWYGTRTVRIRYAYPEILSRTVQLWPHLHQVLYPNRPGVQFSRVD